MSRPKVSVVVPVYNPGRDIDDCIRTLLDQSLPADEYEAIFVDDGSTDATPARLDELAAEHEHVRVEHIPNSGWPGRPRNVGIEMARGDYVYFVDNDDWIEREALERMHAMALRDDADIVIGKVVGHGKSVPRNLFRRNRSGVDLEWQALLWLLTPHKLFRRSFLDEHSLRFPEGRRRLEDHVFVMRAYFSSPSISVLADYPCYHWVLRDVRSNASFGRLDPGQYFANLREVLDIVDEHTEPGAFRDHLYARWYRGKMLNRVRNVHSNPDLNVRRGAVRGDARAGGRALPRERRRVAAIQPRAALAAAARGRLRRPRGAGGCRDEDARAGPRELGAVDAGRRAELELDAELEGLRFQRDGERVVWGEGRADATAGLPTRAPCSCCSSRRSTQDEYRLPAEVELRLVDEADGSVRVVQSIVATIESATVAGGSRCRAGCGSSTSIVVVAGFRMPGMRARRPRQART